MDVLAEMFRHNSMMNTKIVDACRALSGEQLAATAVGTYGSIGATLVHIANGQLAYTSRQRGVERPVPLPEDPFPGIAAVAERMAQGDALLEQCAADVSGLEIEITGDEPGEKWRMNSSLLLVQAINHATEHRTQISTTLTQLGVTPPEMDGWTFFFDAGHMAPA